MVDSKEVIRYEKRAHELIRIDAFLTASFSRYSRSYFQGLLKRGAVRLNGKEHRKNGYVLRDGDVIEVAFFRQASYSLIPQKVEFDLVDEQEPFIVVNKPAGVIVHHSATTGDDVPLTAGLLYFFDELRGVGEMERPGIVHRLDKDTSGLLLVARKQEALGRLAHLFKNRTISKTYLALVVGHPPTAGEVKIPIGRDRRFRHKMASWGLNAREAITRYRVLVYYEDCALLELSIMTGRTHQIRVHCNVIGHPVVGDALYGSVSKHIKRQALHAWKLAFSFDGTYFAYHCVVPDDFKNLLKSVKKL